MKYHCVLCNQLMSNIYEILFMKQNRIDDWECRKCNIKFISNVKQSSILIINYGTPNKKTYDGISFNDCIKNWKLRAFK